MAKKMRIRHDPGPQTPAVAGATVVADATVAEATTPLLAICDITPADFVSSQAQTPFSREQLIAKFAEQLWQSVAEFEKACDNSQSITSEEKKMLKKQPFHKYEPHNLMMATNIELNLD